MIWNRQVLNPIDTARKYWPDADLSHITYDRKMGKGDYRIARQQSHDGTLLFTDEMLQIILLRLINRASYFVPKPPSDWNKVSEVLYRVGPIRLCTVFKDVTLHGHKFPGQQERATIQVRCSFVYKEESL